MCATARWKQFCLQWRLWVHPIMLSCYVIFVVIVVPMLIVNSLKDGFSRKDQLILVGGLFVLTAIPFSVYHICQHIVHFTKPILQKHIIRILWMVPIYALNAVSCEVLLYLAGFIYLIIYLFSGWGSYSQSIRYTWIVFGNAMRLMSSIISWCICWTTSIWKWI